MGKEIEITTENFDLEVLGSKVPVLVDFWAEWCNPCKMIAPVVEKFALQFDGKLKVGKVNVDNHPNVASRYGISGIPALLFFREGNLVHQVVGYQPQEALKEALRIYLKVV